jgi:peptidyl-prolyl cis-trans isomerase C
MRFPTLSLPERTWPRVGVLVVVVALVAVAAVAGYRQLTDLPEDAVLAYDGTVLTEAELSERVDALGALYGVQEPSGEQEQDTFRRDVAKAVAVSLVLDDAAEDHDIVISDKSARDTLAAMVDDQLGPDPQKAFTGLLAKFGVSEDDILEEIKRQQAIARLFREVTQETVDGLTAEDVRAYYDEDPEPFAQPEQRRLRNIVVASRREARAVLTAARRGEDFGVLARRVSLDDATRDKSGELGTVTAAQLDPGFAEVAFAARRGGVFGPVKTSFGWNVGQVLDITPARDVAYAKVEDQVADALRSERALEVWRDWLADRIKDADVEYADDYRPEDPDEPPADSGVGPDTLGEQ